MSNNNSMRRRGPMGGRRGMAPGEKAKDLKGTMIKLIKYMTFLSSNRYGYHFCDRKYRI